jgi:hypothetical protein
VLFVNEYLRDNNKDLITVKNIQLSKYSTFATLENKIQKVFVNIMKNSGVDSTEYEYRLFKYEKEPRGIFDLILAYINKNKAFKLSAKELKKSECNKKTIHELKFNPKDVLIVEVLSKNMLVKPFIKIITETVNCSLCNTIIKEEKLYCDNCTQSIYCSANCKTNDSVHIEYHKKVANLFKKKHTLEELSNMKLSTFLDTNSKGGLVGLKNLGETCFINSALQCLSHCEELTKYFISKTFIEDINRQSKQGTEGKIAIVYYELLKEMWLGSASCLSPWDIRNIFVGFAKHVNYIKINISIVRCSGSK